MMIGLNQLSELTGISPKTVKRRLESLPPQDGPNRSLLWNSREALPLLYGLNSQDENSDRLDPQQEKARLDRERRLIVELERAEKEGSLIDKEEAKEQWRAVGMTLNNRAMNLPTTISPSLVGKDQRGIELELKAAMTKLLRGLGDDLHAT